MKLFSFLFDELLTHKYTGVDGKENLFAMYACIADAIFRDLRFTKHRILLSPKGRTERFAWALNDDSKF